MKDILLVFENNMVIVITVVTAVILSVLVILAVLLFRKAKNNVNNDEEISTKMSIPIPQNTAHTLLTEDTLELEPSGNGSVFAVEYEITFVYSEEVV